MSIDLEGGLMGNESELEAICVELRRLLDRAVQRSLSGGRTAIMLSGGLDTSIIALIAFRHARVDGYTVALRGAPAPDIGFSSLMANVLGMKHKVHYLDETEVLELIPAVVKTLCSFDPMQIRNSLAVYAGMKAAKEDGVEVAITGDGADELMAGYSFAFSLGKEALDLELRKLWSVMAFSSIPLAESLGMAARLPFMDPDFKHYAMAMDSKFKVGSEGGQTYGKWVLRKAYEGLLPREITWRTKTPIEYGSGTTTFPKLFCSRINDAEFAEKKEFCLREDRVTIRDKEHLAYYEAFRSAFGPPPLPHPHPYPHPPRPSATGKTCPQCNSGVPQGSTFCRTCGAYPI